MGYVVIRKKLTLAVVAEAERLLADGRHRPMTEWREPRTGLALRFNVASASFLLRTAGPTVTLGRLGALGLPTMRHLAEQAKQAIADERDAPEYVRTYRERVDAGDDHNTAHTAATHASSRTGGVAYDADRPWRWSTLVEGFVAHKEDELKPGRWAKQYGRYFDDPVFNPIRAKRVCDVSHADLFALKRTLVPAGAKKVGSRAFRIISQTVDMLNWAQAEMPIECNLLGADPVWRAISVKYKPGKRSRAPKPAELARMLLAVERHAGVGDGALAASRTLQTLLWFVFFTAQRDGAAASLRRANIVAHPDLEDWRIAHFPEEDIKGPRDDSLAHAVPLPPILVQALERLWAEIDLDGKSPFAFPSVRGKTHLSAARLNVLFRDLRGLGRDERPTPKPHYEGKPGPKPRDTRVTQTIDLFELYLRELRPHKDSETYFWLHDVRRSLANHLSNAGLGRAASAILAHRMETDPGEKDEESFRERMSRTTSRFYFTAQQIALKTDGLALWAGALEAALASERASFGLCGAADGGDRSLRRRPACSKRARRAPAPSAARFGQAAIFRRAPPPSA